MHLSNDTTVNECEHNYGKQLPNIKVLPQAHQFMYSKFQAQKTMFELRDQTHS